MPLPKLTTPTYKTKVPSTQKEIEFRPFLVKEQKILYMALESNDVKDITRAIKEILDNTIYTDIDINTLTPFDLEYIFIKLRAKSVGETVEVKILVDDCECEPKTQQQVVINLEDLEVTFPEKVDKLIMLTDTIGIEMKYPNASMIEDMVGIGEEQSIDAVLDTIAMCVNTVIEGDAISSDYTPEELKTFLESMSAEQLEKIGKFFQAMPKIQKEVEVSCQECGKKSKHMIQGIDNFFG